ncbi:MAG: glycosyltransferase family 2 protein [Deltaproteobacteria bacterium]
MTQKPPPAPLDLTFVVLAYNEEACLRATVDDCVGWMRRAGQLAPILIMDDGSTDRTAEIADDLAREHRDIRVVHIAKNAGQFNAIRTSWPLVATTYFAVIPGDNQFDMRGFDLFLPHIGKYDVIFGFPNNEEVRGKMRGVLSHLWRIYLLSMFGVSVVYLGGLAVLPVDLVRSTRIESEGFLGIYELMTRICTSGANWIQIPFVMRDRAGGQSAAVKPLRNLADLARMTLLWTRIKGPGILPAGRDYREMRQTFASFAARSGAHRPTRDRDDAGNDR